MTHAFFETLAADLAPHVDTLTAAAKGVAQSRAAGVSALSGGAITATAEQVEAIESKAVEELFDELRERLRDVARTYATTQKNLNPEA